MCVYIYTRKNVYVCIYSYIYVYICVYNYIYYIYIFTSENNSTCKSVTKGVIMYKMENSDTYGLSNELSFIVFSKICARTHLPLTSRYT